MNANPADPASKDSTLRDTLGLTARSLRTSSERGAE